jgi:hypothetical protein
MKTYFINHKTIKGETMKEKQKEIEYGIKTIITEEIIYYKDSNSYTKYVIGKILYNPFEENYYFEQYTKEEYEKNKKEGEIILNNGMWHFEYCTIDEETINYINERIKELNKKC